MSEFQVIGPSSKNKGPHKFYKGFKYTFDGLERIISLGKFFFMKISDDVPICVGELQLIWEDRNCTSELASVKLYFVPEDTPEGRLLTHGEVNIYFIIQHQQQCVILVLFFLFYFFFIIIIIIIIIIIFFGKKQTFFFR